MSWGSWGASFAWDFVSFVVHVFLVHHQEAFAVTVYCPPR